MSARACLGLLACAASVLAGCTNSQSSVNSRPHTGTATASSVGGVQQVTIEVGVDDRFHPSTIVVHPGRVQIVLKHDAAGAPHNLSIGNPVNVFVPTIDSGRSESTSFTAPAPGKYQFVCTLHAKLGMTGTLVVKP